MPVTIVDAITNLVKRPILKVESEYRSRNRANSVGEALEEYVKDLFADSFGCGETERRERLSRVFSYTGNNSNPPDAMLDCGDAIEVKKIEGRNEELALNSSYPKHKLYSDDPMLTRACVNAEDWREKDMLYVVGYVNRGVLKDLAMVYGLDYCASDECYKRMKSTIAAGVNMIPGVEFSETKELGRVNKVDPLGITYLRVRGMWGMQNPWSVYDYIYRRDERQKLNFMCLINADKWRRTPNAEELYGLAENNPRLKIADVRIKSPDNPVKLNDAKLITFTVC